MPLTTSFHLPRRTANCSPLAQKTAPCGDLAREAATGSMSRPSMVRSEGTGTPATPQTVGRISAVMTTSWITWQAGETRHDLPRGVHGVMHGVEGAIEEEGIGAGRAQKANGFVTQAPGEVLPILEDFFAVAPEVVEIHAPRFAPIVAVRVVVHAAVQKAVEIVEAAGVGHGIGGDAEVPLAGQRGLVAGGLEQGRDGFLGGGQVQAVDGHAGTDGEAAGHEGGAGGRAHGRVRIPVGETRAGGG